MAFGNEMGRAYFFQMEANIPMSEVNTKGLTLQDTILSSEPNKMGGGSDMGEIEYIFLFPFSNSFCSFFSDWSITFFV